MYPTYVQKGLPFQRDATASASGLPHMPCTRTMVIACQILVGVSRPLVHGELGRSAGESLSTELVSCDRS
jgi:hypothetical protein